MELSIPNGKISLLGIHFSLAKLRKLTKIPYYLRWLLRLVACSYICSLALADSNKSTIGAG